MKRKEEHAAMLNRKGKSERKVFEGIPSGPASKEASATEDVKANGNCEMLLNQSLDEKEEPKKITSWKGPGELKEPKVLEVN